MKLWGRGRLFIYGLCVVCVVCNGDFFIWVGISHEGLETNTTTWNSCVLAIFSILLTATIFINSLKPLTV